MKNVCEKVSKRYEIIFLEIGSERNHIYFIIKSVSTYSLTKIVTKIKSILAREIFSRCLDVKKQLWDGEIWSDGYFVSTFSEHVTETVIREYIKNQGNKGLYKQLHKEKSKFKQLSF